MTLLKSLLVAAALALPVAASAAPVPVYSASGAALFDGQFADFFDDGSDDTDISLFVEYAGGTLSGSLLVSDLTGTLLESSAIIDVLFDIKPGPDSVTLLFGSLGGSAAPLFTGWLAAVFSFSLEDEDAGAFDPVGVTLYATPVPVPASIGLLVLGLGALAATARRRM